MFGWVGYFVGLEIWLGWAGIEIWLGQRFGYARLGQVGDLVGRG